MQGDSLSEEADSQEDSQEWRGPEVESGEPEQEGVVEAKSEVTIDDRVVRTEGEEVQVESNDKLQQSIDPLEGVESEQQQESGDVPSEAVMETTDNPEVDAHVKGPSTSSRPQQRQVTVPPSQSDRHANKASIGSHQNKKRTEAIPDLTRQSLEEEGDGKRPACMLQCSSLTSL